MNRDGYSYEMDILMLHTGILFWGADGQHLAHWDFLAIGRNGREQEARPAGCRGIIQSPQSIKVLPISSWTWMTGRSVSSDCNQHGEALLVVDGSFPLPAPASTRKLQVTLSRGTAACCHD
jgi:hypothetical protein